MTKTVKFMGKEWKLENDAPLWVFVPEGEAEAYVFLGDKFFGRRSDIEGGTLQSLMQGAEDAASKRCNCSCL